MRKFIYGILFTVFGIVSVVAIVAAVVAINLQSRVGGLEADLQAKTTAEEQIAAELQQAQEIINTPITFSDSGLGFSISFPVDWKVSSVTPVDYNVAPGNYLPVVLDYKLMLTKSDTEIGFQTILGGVGFMVSGYTNADHEYVLIDEAKSLVRVREKTKNDWSLQKLIECEAGVDEFLGFTPDFCTDPTFPGFAQDRPTVAWIKSATSAEILTEVDQIVRSAL